MVSLLSKALIVLILVLLIPTGLVFASQDAVPGDGTYSIKRSLENVIVTVASLHPATRAFFKTDMATRRYKEAIVLINRGDLASSKSLTELVAQTQSAAVDINQISDPVAKQKLIDNLSVQITQYQAGLVQLGGTAPVSAPSVSQPIPTPTTVQQPADSPAAIKPTPLPTGITPQPTVPVQSAPLQAGTSAQPTPRVTTSPTRTAASPTATATPTPTTAPTPTPMSILSPTPVANPASGVSPDIQGTIDDLNAIKEGLKRGPSAASVERKPEKNENENKDKVNEDKTNRKVSGKPEH